MNIKYFYYLLVLGWANFPPRMLHRPPYWQLIIWYDQWHNNRPFIFKMISAECLNIQFSLLCLKIFLFGGHIHPWQNSYISHICGDAHGTLLQYVFHSTEDNYVMKKITRLLPQYLSLLFSFLPTLFCYCSLPTFYEWFFYSPPTFWESLHW